MALLTLFMGGFERSCPRVSKNVSYVDVILVQTFLDLIVS